MQRQDEELFTTTVEDNKYSIYRICRIYAVPPIEAQDLFQEVVYQIWKSLPDFEEKSNINTWIYKIALNVCMRSKNQLSKGNPITVRLESIEFNFQFSTLISELKSKMSEFETNSIKSDITQIKSSWNQYKEKVSQFEKKSITSDLKMITEFIKKTLQKMKLKQYTLILSTIHYETNLYCLIIHKIKNILILKERKLVNENSIRH
ncbi:RNA polymerase sigma factor [Algoriphagus aquimarinus]|uniref:RNA polymerase sigma factor n=1 Tax=Algoriphagus aquimarinus TaxID=237018 RepID=UPI0030DB1269|tara:strand:- start:170786 stop:171400 length:615 start_codon:yes stop_codon:yes gene_type:complete